MDRAYYDAALQTVLSDYFIDNFTDFTDSVCFTFFIGCGDTKFSVGSELLNNFLRCGNVAYYVKMQISTVEPLICVQFFRYKSPTSPDVSDEPFIFDQKEAYSAICLFAKEHGFTVKSYSDLISESGVSLYEHLFEPL